MLVVPTVREFVNKKKAVVHSRFSNRRLTQNGHAGNQYSFCSEFLVDVTKNFMVNYRVLMVKEWKRRRMNVSGKVCMHARSRAAGTLKLYSLGTKLSDANCICESTPKWFTLHCTLEMLIGSKKSGKREKVFVSFLELSKTVLKVLRVLCNLHRNF